MDTTEAGSSPATATTETQATIRTPEPISRATLWSALTVLGLGALTVLVIYLPIRHLQAHDHSAPALEMPSMRMYRTNIFWAMPLLEASGFAALIWAYLGLCLGLLEAGGASRWEWLPLTPTSRVRVHRQISILVLGLILVHAVATACDAMGDNVLSAFVPFEEGYKPARLAFDVGIFAFYLALLVGPTYYVRRWVGVKRWRIMHRLAGIVYILALWHTLIVGDDVAHYSWLHPLIWLLQIPLLILFVIRLAEQARASNKRDAARLSRGISVSTRDLLIRRTSLTLATVGAVAIIGVVVLVATGSYGTIVSSNPF